MFEKTILAIGWILFLSCNEGNYSIAGAVKRIEKGKDGYTAIILTKSGDSVSATISRVDMGFRYKELEVGDKVKIYGDSMMYGNEISITATKIVE